MKNIYPLKVFNSVFFTLLIFYICLSGVFYKTNPELVGRFFLIGLIVVMVTALPNFLFHGIKVNEKDVTIKMFGVKGYKKYIISIKDISKLEMKKGKAYFGIRRYYFVLHFYEGSEKESFIINEERYFVRHLQSLFYYLGEKYMIPYENYHLVS